MALWLLYGLAACTSSRLSKKNATKPHIVYLLTDNLGYGNVGYLRARTPAGPTPEVQTPRLDALVQEGIELERLYTYKFCSPSRSSLLSGRLPIHVNIHNSPYTLPGAGIPELMTTLPRKMKEAGYRTHQVGKWHVGFSTPSRTPRGRGFDTSFGYLQAFNGYLHSWSGQHCEQFPGTVSFNSTGEGARCTAKSVAARHLGFTTDLWETEDEWEGPARGLNGTGFEEAQFLNRVIGLIEGHDQGGPPMFLYYAMHLLHSPLCTPQGYLDRFAFIDDNEDRRYVAAMTAYLDDVVGDVVSALKRTGMWANTVFVWSSDNGAAIELTTGAKSAYPLKGGYYTNWEGGIRAPGFLSGGFLPASQRNTSRTGLVHLCDWYATFCALAGVDPQDTVAAKAGLPPIDSINQWPYLSGATSTPARTEIAFTPLHGDTDPHGGDSCYIMAPYKLILNQVHQADWTGPRYPNASRWDTWRTVENCTIPGVKAGCLFDVYEDPNETNDLALKMPQKVQEILARMNAVEATVFDPKRGSEQNRQACDALVKRGGFWGPWINVTV